MRAKQAKTNRNNASVNDSKPSNERKKGTAVDDGDDGADGNNADDGVRLNDDDIGSGNDNDKINNDNNGNANNDDKISNNDENNSATATTTTQKQPPKTNNSSTPSKINEGLVRLYHVIVILNINNYSESE